MNCIIRSAGHVAMMIVSPSLPLLPANHQRLGRARAEDSASASVLDYSKIWARSKGGVLGEDRGRPEATAPNEKMIWEESNHWLAQAKSWDRPLSRPQFDKSDPLWHTCAQFGQDNLTKQDATYDCPIPKGH